MLIYKWVQTFDRHTGKPAGKELVIDRCICDYCGKIIDDDNMHLETTYTVNEVGGSEEQFYYEEYPQGVDKYKLFGGKNRVFHFCQNFGDCGQIEQYCEVELISEWFLNLTNPKSCFRNSCLLANVLYTSRLRVLKKLIEAGATPEQLGVAKD